MSTEFINSPPIILQDGTFHSYNQHHESQSLQELGSTITTKYLKRNNVVSIQSTLQLEPQVGKYSNTQTLKRHATKKIYLLLRCPRAIALASVYVLISIGAGGPPPFSTARAPGTGGATVTAESWLVAVVDCAPASVVAVGDCALSANAAAAVSEMEGSAAVVAAAS
jgi:hypothetical protein